MSVVLQSICWYILRSKKHLQVRIENQETGFAVSQSAKKPFFFGFGKLQVTQFWGFNKTQVAISVAAVRSDCILE